MAVRREMRALLCLLLKAVSFLGLVFVCFGVNYVPTLLAVLPGAKWATPEVSKAAAGSFIHSFIHSFHEWERNYRARINQSRCGRCGLLPHCCFWDSAID